MWLFYYSKCDNIVDMNQVLFWFFAGIAIKAAFGWVGIILGLFIMFFYHILKNSSSSPERDSLSYSPFQ
jgi:hypothetical protein